MDAKRAKALLLLHSCGTDDINHPKWSGGFVGSLRPYRGLNEDNFHEVMAAIVALGPHLTNAQFLDREIVNALWGLRTMAHDWGLHPNGMLWRNGLISNEDIERLAGWVEAIEYAVMVFLDHAPDVAYEDVIDEALASYRQVTDHDFPPDY